MNSTPALKGSLRWKSPSNLDIIWASPPHKSGFYPTYSDFVNNPLPFTNTGLSFFMFPFTSTTVPYQTPHPGSVSGFRHLFPFTGALQLLLCRTKSPGPCKTWALNTSPCTGQIINEHFLHSSSLSNNAGGSSREPSYPSPQQSPACVRIYKHYQ